MIWYAHYPDAFLIGVANLTPEERGVYITIIDLLYSRDGELRDDDHQMARACNCRPQTWRRIRDQLVAAGKVRVLHGNITANRVEKELEARRKRSSEMRVLAGKRWRINGGSHAAPQCGPAMQNTKKERLLLPSASETEPARESKEAGGRESKLSVSSELAANILRKLGGPG